MNKLKELMEKRSAVIAELDTMVNKLSENEEIRAFTDEELSAYNSKKAEAEALTASIKAIGERRSEGNTFEKITDTSDGEKAEIRAFETYLRTGKPPEVESRADSNWTTSANGAVLPTVIANKIIDKVSEISPLYNLATHYNIGGTLNIPYYDESTTALTVAYAEEFSELESTAGQFKSISLGGYLVGALSKISKSLINNSNFPIVDYVVMKIAQKFALWIDNELINGTSSKIEGLSGVTQITTAASADVITADELITVQDAVPDVFQPNCVWLMSKSARSAVRKLKDGEGNYLLNKDATSKWGYTLFGRPVYISDGMPELAGGNIPIYYGDFSGLAVKVSENFTLQLLLEKYATQHAVGAVAYMEIDSKVENAQKISALKMAEA